MKWFSANLRVACLIEGIGLTRYTHSVHVFQAEDFAEAMRRALDIGTGHEEEYANADGRRVRWRLAAVISLDLVGDDLTDGAEVYSEPVEVGSDVKIDFDYEFHPEQSKPTQTI